MRVVPDKLTTLDVMDSSVFPRAQLNSFQRVLEEYDDNDSLYLLHLLQYIAGDSEAAGCEYLSSNLRSEAVSPDSFCIYSEIFQ